MATKYAFWPGCVSKGAAPELYIATNRVAQALGIELVELEQATCTGAGVIQEQAPELADALNARTFALAQQLNLPLMNICSTCQGIESMVQDKLAKNPDYLAKINAILSEEGGAGPEPAGRGRPGRGPQSRRVASTSARNGSSASARASGASSAA